MDGEGTYVNLGINGMRYTHAFIDNGCLSYAIISDRLARNLKLPRIRISSRALEQVTTDVVPDAIDEVAYASIDIDGHKQRRVFFYIVKKAHEDVILGKPWMVKEEVEIRPARREIYIGTSGLVVKEREPGDKTRFPLEQQMGVVFAALVRRERKRVGRAEDKLRISSASLADIEKTLASEK